MAVKSYILIPKDNQREELMREVSTLGGCEVIPAENKEVLVLVTESDNEDEDKKLVRKIEMCEYLKHISLVSGFKE